MGGITLRVSREASLSASSGSRSSRGIEARGVYTNTAPELVDASSREEFPWLIATAGSLLMGRFVKGVSSITRLSSKTARLPETCGVSEIIPKGTNRGEFGRLMVCKIDSSISGGFGSEFEVLETDEFDGGESAKSASRRALRRFFRCSQIRTAPSFAFSFGSW